MAKEKPAASSVSQTAPLSAAVVDVNVSNMGDGKREKVGFTLLICTVQALPYLTLPSGWAGYYTCPALRPYQFGPMRNPDVTRRSQ